MELVKQILSDVVLQVIVAVVVPVVGVFMVKLINAVIRSIEESKYLRDSELVRVTLESLRELLITDVQFAYNNFSKQIKQDIADGKLSKEEGRAALENLGRDILNQLKKHKPEYFEILGVDRIVREMENIYEKVKG